MSSPAQRRATVITSLNRKWGVGKTHLCWLLALMCQEQGRKCLVIDLDPQANFSSSFFRDGDGPTVEQLFSPAAEPDIAPLIRKTPYDCIDVVASSARLEPFNVPDARTWQKSDLRFSLLEPASTDADAAGQPTVQHRTFATEFAKVSLSFWKSVVTNADMLKAIGDIERQIRKGEVGLTQTPIAVQKKL